MKTARKENLSRQVPHTYAVPGSHLIAKKVSRNSRCACGSGKKSKHCCGVDTKYYQEKNFNDKANVKEQVERTFEDE